MKNLKFLGVFIFMLGLFAWKAPQASATSLTGGEKALVAALNPHLAENTNWQRIVGSGGTVALILNENNITYLVTIYGPNNATWITDNGNVGMIFSWIFNGTWIFEKSEPYVGNHGITLHDYCP